MCMTKIRRGKNGKCLLGGVRICRELLIKVAFLLLRRVKVGAEIDECSGDDTSRTV